MMRLTPLDFLEVKWLNPQILMSYVVILERIDFPQPFFQSFLSCQSLSNFCINIFCFIHHSLFTIIYLYTISLFIIIHALHIYHGWVHPLETFAIKHSIVTMIIIFSPSCGPHLPFQPSHPTITK